MITHYWLCCQKPILVFKLTHTSDQLLQPILLSGNELETAWTCISSMAWSIFSSTLWSMFMKARFSSCTSSIRFLVIGSVTSLWPLISVCWLVGRSVCHSFQKDGKLQFHATIWALVKTGIKTLGVKPPPFWRLFTNILPPHCQSTYHSMAQRSWKSMRLD